MIIRLARHDRIRTINVVRRREAVQKLKDLGADEVIVSGDGPINEQVRKIVGPRGVDFAIDPVAGRTGSEIFRSLSEDGRMLLYGSLTGEGVTVGDDPRYTLSGRRTLEVFWLGYWLLRLGKAGFFPPDRPAILQLIERCAADPPRRARDVTGHEVRLERHSRRGRRGRVGRPRRQGPGRAQPVTITRPPAGIQFTAAREARRSHPWKGDRSPAAQASRSPGLLRSQSGRISLVAARRSRQRSSTDGRPQNQ